MEVAAGVHRFDTGPFNWYVVEEAGRLTVIDAGFPGHYQVLLDGLKSLGRELKDVVAVLLTHGHADHTGFAERLRLASGAPVFVHSADRDSVRRRGQLPWLGLLSNAWRRQTRAMLLHATWNGVFRLPRVSQVRTFEDGAALDVPGRPVAIHTPGHTPGEASFHLPDRGVLVCGDALATQDVFTGAAGRPVLLPPALNADHAAAARSLDRLKGLGRVTLLPGHGPAWAGDMAEAVEAAGRPHTPSPMPTSAM